MEDDGHSRRFGFDDPIQLDASPTNPVGLFENATCEFEDVNLSRRRSSEVGSKRSQMPQTLDEYQRKIQNKLASEEKESVTVIEPSDNTNF